MSGPLPSIDSKPAGELHIVFHRALDRDGNVLRGLFAAIHGNFQLCISCTPFRDGARMLIAQGYDPHRMLSGVNGNDITWRMTLGDAASWVAVGNVLQFRRREQ